MSLRELPDKHPWRFLGLAAAFAAVAFFACVGVIAAVYGVPRLGPPGDPVITAAGTPLWELAHSKTRHYHPKPAPYWATHIGDVPTYTPPAPEPLPAPLPTVVPVAQPSPVASTSAPPQPTHTHHPQPSHSPKPSPSHTHPTPKPSSTEPVPSDSGPIPTSISDSPTSPR